MMSNYTDIIFFFFTDTAPTELYTLSLHDALPISAGRRLGDLAERLVADDAALRHAMVEVALEDMEVRPADADALDPEQGLAGPWRGGCQGPGRERPRALVEGRSHPGILPCAGVTGAAHAAGEADLEPRFIEGETHDIEQPAQHRIGPVTDLVRLAGALHSDRRDLLEHRIRLLPGRSA